MVNPKQKMEVKKENKESSVEYVHYSYRAPKTLVAEIRLYLAKYFQVYGKKLTLTDFLLEAAKEYMKNHPVDSEK
jgi:hypothetical protein